MSGLLEMSDVVCAAAGTGAAWLLAGRSDLNRLGLAPSARPPRAPRVPLRRSPAAVRWGCLVTGVLLGTAGLGVVGLVIGGALAAVLPGVVRRSEAPDVGRTRRQVASALPVTGELLAAALQAGADPPWALDRVGRAVGGPLGDRLVVAARAYRLGSDPVQAWEGVVRDGGEHLAPLAEAFVGARVDGSALSGRVQEVARRAREVHAAAALTAAERAGVRAVAPLGLCFLPAFVAVGVAPVVAAALSHLQL